MVKSRIFSILIITQLIGNIVCPPTVENEELKALLEQIIAANDVFQVIFDTIQPKIENTETLVTGINGKVDNLQSIILILFSIYPYNDIQIMTFDMVKIIIKKKKTIVIKSLLLIFWSMCKITVK